MELSHMNNHFIGTTHKFIFLLANLFFTGYCIAQLPIAPCHSVCLSTQHALLPSDARCIDVGDKLMYYRLLLDFG